MRNKLSVIGLSDLGKIYENLTEPQLYEEIIRKGEGVVSEHGAMIVETGAYTGRSPEDKFVVREPTTEADVWWGPVNRPFEADRFDALYDRVTDYLKGKEVYVQDLFGGVDPEFRLSVRVINELAWHSLFGRNMLVRPRTEELVGFEPDWHLVYAPGFQAVPERDGTRSEVFVLLHFGRKILLIGGTRYAGELKKSVFTLLNYLLPQRDVFPMHCSANKNSAGKTTLFFGLSGTGKTTLSSNAKYELIGDDEHGWSDDGVFNFEGGCYAKTIRLNAETEPEIYATTQRFGTVLENVIFDPRTRQVDLDDAALTENTRCSYPLHFIPNASSEGTGGHPANIIMLTCDAFGVLPPVARLTPDQARYHFISGYTAKVAGTERGVTEPSATFSPCFGAPFMVLHPTAYARQLGERMERHGANCWLVNTGWNGGPYGEGERIKIAHTRAIVAAIVDGHLDGVPFEKDPVFGIDVPTTCPGVPSEILRPRDTWRDQAAYDEKAAELVRMFGEHFTAYEELAPDLKAVAP
jgi:phosphoenolpyruvate carboxykinase (ATP)